MLAVKTSIDRSHSMRAEVSARKVETRARVLCATYARSASDAAVWRAHAIAQTLGAQLLLLHVLDSSKPLRDRRRRGARAHFILDAHLRRFPHADTRAQTSVRSGRAHDTIAEVSIEWNADLIVLGPYRRRFGESVLGTTAERIARKAERPVLVVNRDATTPYEHVLLTSDLSRMAIGSAHVTRQLGLLTNSRASVVHALAHTREMLYLAGVSERQIAEYQRALRQMASEEIQVHLAEAGVGPANVPIFSLLTWPTRAIEQVSRSAAADLVVIGSNRFPLLKRVFVGSVSHQILREAEHDVLLISPAAARRTRQRGSGQNTDLPDTAMQQPVPRLH